jgi:hypothetical protein
MKNKMLRIAAATAFSMGALVVSAGCDRGTTGPGGTQAGKPASEQDRAKQYQNSYRQQYGGAPSGGAAQGGGAAAGGGAGAAMPPGPGAGR